MEVFPKDATLFVSLDHEILGIAVFTDTFGKTSLSGTQFLGIIHSSFLKNLYEYPNSTAYAYVLDEFYESYFTKIKPLEECSNYTLLRGTIKSSRPLGHEPSTIKFNKENHAFIPLVYSKCFSKRPFRFTVNSLARSAYSKRSTFQYYPCIEGEELGVCFNTSLII